MLKKIKSYCIETNLTARKFKISTINVMNPKEKLIIKSEKMFPGPKYVKDQKERAKRSFRRLYKLSVASGGKKFSDKGDETYYPVDLRYQVPGKKYYNTVNIRILR